ncbi:hypothetical protein EMCRGX_G014869 [Ephydatia muelleri]
MTPPTTAPKIVSKQSPSLTPGPPSPQLTTITTSTLSPKLSEHLQIHFRTNTTHHHSLSSHPHPPTQLLEETYIFFKVSNFCIHFLKSSTPVKQSFLKFCQQHLAVWKRGYPFKSIKEGIFLTGQVELLVLWKGCTREDASLGVSGRVPGTKKTQSPSVLVSQSGTMKTSTPNGQSSVRIGGAKSKETSFTQTSFAGMMPSCHMMTQM